jgi:hypothetical protein
MKMSASLPHTTKQATLLLVIMRQAATLFTKQPLYRAAARLAVP